ncbi:MAG: hypothetical protein Q8K75_08635 [Chlamydiales bacterium]|nr:hypothetical protein [Chlamydiales bacterium]
MHSRDFLFFLSQAQPLPFDFYDYTWVGFSIAVVIAVVLMMIGLLWYGYKASKRRPPNSIYGDLPLRRAAELPYESIGKVYLFLMSIHQYDNRMFNINRASVCRTTGRIFPNAEDIFGRTKLDWTFLQARYQGDYVSWGSLNEVQQNEIRRAHHSLEGFQTEYSSPEPSPRAITPEYALERPGPLYVDLQTKVLLGWKRVPGTELEVLIVQKPRKYY